MQYPADKDLISETSKLEAGRKHINHSGCLKLYISSVNLKYHKYSA